MSSLSISYRADIRAARRRARRDVRIMARNIKRAAARRGLRNIATLSLAAGVPLRRTALMWFGVTFTIDEMTRFMVRLDLTTADLFAGTGNND